MKRTGIMIVAACFILSLCSAVLAEGTLKDDLSRNFRDTKDICPVVKKFLSDGVNTKEVTKDCIQLGHDACLVVRCAIEANGNLEQILTGALEAGTTSDVCSRCAIQAGVDAKDVAKALEIGLGYSSPMAAALNPVGINLPGGNPAGRSLSASGF